MSDDFYQEMQDVAGEILGEFHQGNVYLLRRPVDFQDAGRPWEPTPAAPAPDAELVNATVRRVDRKFIDGTKILGTEEQVIMPGSVDPAPLETDLIRFGESGPLRRILGVFPIPPSGIPAVFNVVTKS